MGLHVRSQGVEAVHPVIMIPGVISTGLESWGTSDESRQYFRKRLWGSWTMMRALVLDKASWKRHIMLDRDTGLDPPGIKLRAAQGFDAADFFITGYWIWSKILENLATIGYDPSNAFTAAYDWRLSYANLELRDRYFTKLKAYIETAVRSGDGRKTVLLSHSMGSQVLYYFFHWVEAPGHGDGGPSWVQDHVESWINISGCMLGTIKDIPALLSGEMKDTAQLNAFAVYGLEKFLARHERADIFRAMPGISSMLPIGGDAVWGNATWAPDDLPGQRTSFGQTLSFSPAAAAAAGHSETQQQHLARNMSLDQSLTYLFDHADPRYGRAVRANYSRGVAHTAAEVEANAHDPRKWLNPLETRLPLAPGLTIYCFYGVGKATERAYHYRRDSDSAAAAAASNTSTGGAGPVSIDTTVSQRGRDGGAPDSGRGAGEVDHGVVLGEGDGTVNLLSSGYMCARGWRLRRYNPAGARVVVREMPHEPDALSPRGGPRTGDHVDILGRSGLNELILKIAGGRGHEVEERVVSRIAEYADRVKVFEEDEDE